MRTLPFSRLTERSPRKIMGANVTPEPLPFPHETPLWAADASMKPIRLAKHAVECVGYAPRTFFGA